METEAPDSSPITICSLILTPSLSFYLLGLAARSSSHTRRTRLFPGRCCGGGTASPTVGTGPEPPEEAWGWGWRS